MIITITMGIKGISKLIGCTGINNTFANLRSSSIAIDTSIYLYKFKYANIKPHDYISHFVTQIASLKKYNIKPLYVFDTESPEEKKITHDHRKEVREKYTTKMNETECLETKAKLKNYVIHITKDDITNLQKLFTLLEVNYVDCESGTEAEQYCAFLNKNGHVDYVMSNDFDSLTFGCSKLLTCKKGVYTVFTLSDILDKFEVDLDQYIDLCIMCGTDYNPTGIYKVGPVKALSMVKNTYTLPEHLISIRDIFKRQLNFLPSSIVVPYNSDSFQEFMLSLDLEDELRARCERTIKNSFKDNNTNYGNSNGN